MLESDTFVPAIGREHASDSPTYQLIRGLQSEQNEPYGWNNIVQNGLRSDDITLIDPGLLYVRIPQFPDYDLTQPETIVLTIPAGAMRNNANDIAAAASFEVLATRGRAVLSGTLLEDVSEDFIRQGRTASHSNITLEITLQHDTLADRSMCDGDVQNMTTMTAADLPGEWCWPATPFPAGVAAPPPPPIGAPPCVPSQAAGWNYVLQQLPCSSLEILSSTSARFTLPPFPDYDIAAPESVTLVLRADALKSNRQTTATPTFAVRPIRGVATLGGSLLTANESTIRQAQTQLTLTLQDTSWAPQLSDELKLEVLRGISTTTLEPTGWAHVVQRGLLASYLEQVDAASISVTLPRFEEYDILSAEAISVHIPRGALISDRAIDAASFEIAAVPGAATLAGFLDYDSSEAAVRSGISSQWSVAANALVTERMQLRVSLSADEFMPDVSTRLPTLDPPSPRIRQAHRC